MRYLVLSEVLSLYRRVIEQSGGIMAIPNLGASKRRWRNPIVEKTNPDAARF